MQVNLDVMLSLTWGRRKRRDGAGKPQRNVMVDGGL